MSFYFLQPRLSKVEFHGTQGHIYVLKIHHNEHSKWVRATPCRSWGYYKPRHRTYIARKCIPWSCYIVYNTRRPTSATCSGIWVCYRHCSGTWLHGKCISGPWMIKKREKIYYCGGGIDDSGNITHITSIFSCNLHSTARPRKWSLHGSRHREMRGRVHAILDSHS